MDGSYLFDKTGCNETKLHKNLNLFFWDQMASGHRYRCVLRADKCTETIVFKMHVTL